jgi:poly(A) polymerase
MKCGNNIPYLLLHTLADFNAKQVQNKAQNKEFISFLRTLFDHFFAGFQPRSKTPPLITGYDLIDEFGLTPSSRFKKILKLVEEARLSNMIDSKPAALKLVREFLRQAEKP